MKPLTLITGCSILALVSGLAIGYCIWGKGEPVLDAPEMLKLSFDAAGRMVALKQGFISESKWIDEGYFIVMSPPEQLHAPPPFNCGLNVNVIRSGKITKSEHIQLHFPDEKIQVVTITDDLRTGQLRDPQPETPPPR